jgi:hypothetical protein
VTHPQKITFAQLRASGVHSILVYCRDHRCSHHITTNADGWPDEVRLSGSPVHAMARKALKVRPVFEPGADGCRLDAAVRGIR